MEYQKKKKQILSSVEYTNLLTLSLAENKLQRNFKSIVQALLLAQSEGTQLKEDLQSLAHKNSRQISVLHDKLSSLERKLKQMQSKQQVKNVQDTEDFEYEKKSLSNMSEPHLNINLVHSPKNSQEAIPSSKFIEQNRKKFEQFQELKQKLNKLLSEQINASQLDKTINSLKDNINLLKSEVKLLASRQPKSNKRVSLVGIQKIETPIKTQPSSQISGLQQQMEKQINNVHVELNSMKLSLEQMKQLQGELKRKQNKSHIVMDQLGKNHKKLEERVQNANDGFQSQLKELKKELFNIQTKSQQDNESNSKKSKKNIEIKQNISPNANNQINDKLSKLQAAIQGLITQSQFKRFKSQMKDKLSSLQSSDQNIRKEFKEEIQMLTQILDSKEEQLANIQKDIDQLKRKTDDICSGCERKNNISISRHDELKKNLQNLREDLEFYKSMNQLSNQAKTVSNNNNTEQIDQKQKNEPSNNKGMQQLKKYLNRKLHDQRTYLLGLIRDLQKKSGGKSSYEQDILNVWDKLAEVNLFLNKKANQEDIKKSLAFIQKKIANIYQRITSSDQNNEDARVAKTNWFCLSCDKNLHSYQGKVGQHVVWDSLPIKAGYTKYFNKQEKKSLPTLKR